MDKNKIRNFAIIAHIDHGKSTLADRLLEISNTINSRELNAQHLDTMDLEKERGITIKLNAAQIEYKNYIFHLIDTPGHVDFAYEVSRSLAAVEGVLLLIDATQGIEAQTLANVYMALDHNLEIIPVINKIDLPSANIEEVKREIEETIGISADDAILISAKTGLNVEKVFDAIIEKIPAPIDADDNKPLKALVFDSYYDPFRGVIILTRIFNGKIKIGDNFFFLTNKEKVFHVTELGIKKPQEVKKDFLESGEVGWIAASIRDAKQVAIGDTITLSSNPTDTPIDGYKKMKPVVFTGFYPIDGKDYELLKDSLEKISLSDSSITYEPESSKALGHGFRIGFLGLLHMEILQERLSREFNIDLIATAPSVEFIVHKTNKEVLVISNPSEFPDTSSIDFIEEPFVRAEILVIQEFIGSIMELCKLKRGKYIKADCIDSKRWKLVYDMPLNEIIFDFFDKLKSISKGYASFDYTIIPPEKASLVKVDILLNGEKIDAFSSIIHKDFAEERSRELVKKLKELIPRNNFEVPVQAAIGAKIIARETIKAYRKDVTAKLYGGDVTRRQKLLKKQKEGKKRAKAFGKVEVPQDTFIKLLKNK
ncbi:MAG: translation elongation factor 4 [Metamycoplasmataceae bacterium]